MEMKCNNENNENMNEMIMKWKKIINNEIMK